MAKVYIKLTVTGGSRAVWQLRWFDARCRWMVFTERACRWWRKLWRPNP